MPLSYFFHLFLTANMNSTLPFHSQTHIPYISCPPPLSISFQNDFLLSMNFSCNFRPNSSTSLSFFIPCTHSSHLFPLDLPFTSFSYMLLFLYSFLHLFCPPCILSAQSAHTLHPTTSAASVVTSLIMLNTCFLSNCHHSFSEILISNFSLTSNLSLAIACLPFTLM